MARGKRGHEEVDTYESDDFVENDDGNAPRSKKSKKSKKSQGSNKAHGDSEKKFWEVSCINWFLQESRLIVA